LLAVDGLPLTASGIKARGEEEEFYNLITIITRTI